MIRGSPAIKFCTHTDVLHTLTTSHAWHTRTPKTKQKTKITPPQKKKNQPSQSLGRLECAYEEECELDFTLIWLNLIRMINQTLELKVQLGVQSLYDRFPPLFKKNP